MRFERESERRNIRFVERDRDVVTLRLNPQLYLLLECADESVNQLPLSFGVFSDMEPFLMIKMGLVSWGDFLDANRDDAVGQVKGVVRTVAIDALVCQAVFAMVPSSSR